MTRIESPQQEPTTIIIPPSGQCKLSVVGVIAILYDLAALPILAEQHENGGSLTWPADGNALAGNLRHVRGRLFPELEKKPMHNGSSLHYTDQGVLDNTP